MEAFFSYLTDRAPQDLLRDVADVLITYYLIYRTALVLRGTRAMQAGVGLVVLLLLYVASKYFELGTVFAILGAVLPSAILIVVVVFQDDIRRGLMRMGSGAWVGSGHTQEARVIDEVIDAATELARHRTGAIIAFEQDANLDEFVGTHKGVTLDAAVSSQLLVSLFLPEPMNKLHDGAVIIRDLRIAKAGVFFPFKRGTRVVDESFGSRHRAALGITDETDAVLVVVSEERGSISFCFNGNIVSDLDGPRLRAALDSVFTPRANVKSKKGGRWLSLVPASLLPASRRLPSRRAQGKKPPASEGPTSPAATVRLRAPGPSSESPKSSIPAPARPLRKSPVVTSPEPPASKDAASPPSESPAQEEST